MKLLKTLLVGLVSIVFITGCAGTTPIQNVSQTVIGNHTTTEVQKAILAGGINRGWVMIPAAEGVINGKLINRDHTVEIQINYNANNYQIKYIGSTNMDAKNGKIHSKYNRWIANLNKDIQIQLNRLSI
ncbi:hypothetical protein [Yersinia intermedia]|jgi:hypothetical protein|uniref:Lipoprotein n=1 Tax=Yersinia intermedia TaxID=631 RepID=A0A209ACC2_YERIN|nr:hypothetical protein [Yersinia intermedia]MCB5313534.1 hypothetical protein [Yersinia intermedia]MCB5322485.1 hypothetical protein [Yersinia intermedia]MCB5329214.1 hypothetical protein [Yersinia intermedia]OVZ90407.1 hypothetical protein CBW57_00010 [Yersinia intermedia]UNK24309.1 hypothetical protein MNQ97_04775 [Yersinia intermedia]